MLTQQQQQNLDVILAQNGGIRFSELQGRMGNLLYKEKKFLGNVGGAPDADSLRGFASTAQHWQVPTEYGWTALCSDNEFFLTEGIYGAISPEGVEWRWEDVSVDEQTFTKCFVPA